MQSVQRIQKLEKMPNTQSSFGSFNEIHVDPDFDVANILIKKDNESKLPNSKSKKKYETEFRLKEVVQELT